MDEFEGNLLGGVERHRVLLGGHGPVLLAGFPREEVAEGHNHTDSYHHGKRHRQIALWGGAEINGYSRRVQGLTSSSIVF